MSEGIGRRSGHTDYPLSSNCTSCTSRTGSEGV